MCRGRLVIVLAAGVALALALPHGAGDTEDTAAVLALAGFVYFRGYQDGAWRGYRRGRRLFQPQLRRRTLEWVNYRFKSLN